MWVNLRQAVLLENVGGKKTHRISVGPGRFCLVADKIDHVPWLFLTKRLKGTGPKTRTGLPATMWDVLKQREVVSFEEESIPA